jgi:hypothetical protein
MSDKPVVVLIHGIRTAAWWQNRIASVIEADTGATVIPIKYGYFDLLRFLCPFCRSGPVEKLRQQLEGIANTYKDRPLIIFAHSFGTYALTRVIDENPFLRFDRIVLCGSVVPTTFDWRKVQEQVRGAEKRNAIVNECGTRDIWPVLAKSVTWGYGATGTYGFGTFNVRDRFHDIAHSDFFTNEFARKYWVPLVRGEAVAFSDQDVAGAGAPGWFMLLGLPLRWVPVVALLAAAIPLLLPYTVRANCAAGQTKVGDECFSTERLATAEELQAKVRHLAIEVQNTLDVKSDRLFPTMDRYLSDPTSQRWQEVKVTALELLGVIRAGLDEIVDGKGTFLTNSGSGKTYYVTRDARPILVKPGFKESLDAIRDQFRGRATIIDEMERANDPPSTEKIREWRSELEKLHQKLEQALRELGELLVVSG